MLQPISTPTEKVRAYGRVEKFQMMVQKNNALLQLKDEFGLELYICPEEGIRVWQRYLMMSQRYCGLRFGRDRTI